jgi:hypothetical protein
MKYMNWLIVKQDAGGWAIFPPSWHAYACTSEGRANNPYAVRRTLKEARALVRREELTGRLQEEEEAERNRELYRLINQRKEDFVVKLKHYSDEERIRFLTQELLGAYGHSSKQQQEIGTQEEREQTIRDLLDKEPRSDRELADCYACHLVETLTQTQGD